MLTIHKFPLVVAGEQYIDLPDSYEPMCVAEQNDVVTVWVMLDPKQPKKPTKIYIHGTGHEISNRHEKKYIGTVHQKNGLVWHIFH